MIGFSLLVFLAMFIFAGLAIDLMRHELHRTRIQATMDRALLAAAHPDQQTNRKNVVLDYFKRAGLDGIVKRDDIKVQVAWDGTSVSATADSRIHTPFMKFAGVSSLRAPAGGGAAKANVLTEISLVVDVSGSMENNSVNGVSKIKELRDAATEFSNLLLCDPNNPASPADWTTCPINGNKTSLTLVPYSSQVSLGSTLLGKFTVADTHDKSSCVTFAADDFDDVSVSTTDTIHQTAQYVGGGQRYLNNYYKLSTSGWVEPESSPQWYETYWSCFNADWREVHPFENSPQDMALEISKLKGLGGTAIHVGMKWGAALLHHDAAPAITSLIDDNSAVHSDFRGRPFNPATTSSSKIIVLMTDGINSSNTTLKDGFRTGLSPIWYNSDERVLSVLDDRDTPEDDSDDRWYWFNPENTRNRGRDLPYGEWRDHPFGHEGANDCFYDYGVGTLCTPGRTPENTLTERLDWKDYWQKGYTLRIFDSFPHIGNEVDTPGRSTGGIFLSNSTSNAYLSSGFPNKQPGETYMNVDKLLIDQCDAAKLAGMTIYTIEMETPDTSTDVMSACASTKEGNLLYYKVDENLDLSTVFGRIAEDINRLRLTH